MPITEFAPAKINLYLHVTGRRADGYHHLDSLTVFAGIGDEIRLEPATSFAFSVEGPRAHELKNEPAASNLVVRAAESLAKKLNRKLDARLTLTKNLPTASGIGGGSSDAGAALRALATHWGLVPNDPRLVEAAAEHGQDVPAGLFAETCYLTMGGTAPGPELPHADIVLVNPGKALPTPEVYKAFREGGYGFSPAARLSAAPADTGALMTALRERGNDLTKAAIGLMPEIADILASLEKSGAGLARMSGSGATCFGLYTDRAGARQAASLLHARHPEWWVAQSHVPIRRDRRRQF